MRVTNSIPQHARKSPGVFLCLAALLLLIMLYLTVRIQFQTNHHKKHDKDATNTEQCLNRNGVSYAVQEAASGRCEHTADDETDGGEHERCDQRDLSR